VPDPLLLFGAFAAGYLLGRTRPIRSVREWAWWSIQTYGRRHASTPQTLVALVLWPGIAWKAFRAWRRNDPSASRLAAAPKLDEKWQAKLDEGREP
jgi:hypothetical protein